MIHFRTQEILSDQSIDKCWSGFHRYLYSLECESQSGRVILSEIPLLVTVHTVEAKLLKMKVFQTEFSFFNSFRHRRLPSFNLSAASFLASVSFRRICSVPTTSRHRFLGLIHRRLSPVRFSSLMIFQLLTHLVRFPLDRKFSQSFSERLIN